ncbi:MAG: hypothetical protein ACOYNS_10410 [Bacteroidota bacterium]
MRTKEVKNDDGSHFGWAIKCPGCCDYHIFDNRWTFNGDMERPTFIASMLSKMSYTNGRPDSVCHSYVTDGRIEFLGDCTHDLKYKTVDLPDIDPMWNEKQ